jgi:hypothetical protein
MNYEQIKLNGELLLPVNRKKAGSKSATSQQGLKFAHRKKRRAMEEYS